MPRVSWSEDATGELRRLWSAGTSATQIARQMGNLTRNAVLGKAHRLGLPTRKPLNEGRVTRKKVATKYSPRPRKRPRGPSPFADLNLLAPKHAKPPKPRITGLPAPEPLMLSLTDLGNMQCHYIDGDPREASHGYCGHPVHSRQMCAYHHALCYRPVEERKRERAGSATRLFSFDAVKPSEHHAKSPVDRADNAHPYGVAESEQRIVAA